MNESIETINYKNYQIELSYDTYSDNPNEWGNSTVAIFDSGYRGELNNTTRDEFYDDNDNLLIGVRSQLRAGTAYAVGVRHYSSSDGGFYTLLDDATEADGFITLAPEYVKGVSKADRLEYARGDLKTYQEWANGNVYAVYIYDRAGELVDGCGGLYGDYDDLVNDAKATIDRLPLIHDAAYAKKAGALHV